MMAGGLFRHIAKQTGVFARPTQGWEAGTGFQPEVRDG